MNHKLPLIIRKLLTLLENPRYAHIICWHKSNRSFLILNPSEFTREVLSSENSSNVGISSNVGTISNNIPFANNTVGNNISFTNTVLSKGGNIQSFIRTLHKYGFHKLKPTEETKRDYGLLVWEFGHEWFIRGRRDLMERINRKKNTKKNGTTSNNSINNSNSNNNTTCNMNIIGVVPDKYTQNSTNSTNNTNSISNNFTPDCSSDSSLLDVDTSLFNTYAVNTITTLSTHFKMLVEDVESIKKEMEMTQEYIRQLTRKQTILIKIEEEPERERIRKVLKDTEYQVYSSKEGTKELLLQGGMDCLLLSSRFSTSDRFITSDRFSTSGGYGTLENVDNSLPTNCTHSDLDDILSFILSRNINIPVVLITDSDESPGQIFQRHPMISGVLKRPYEDRELIHVMRITTMSRLEKHNVK